MSAPFRCYTEITQQADAWHQAVEAVLAVQKSLVATFDRLQPDSVIFLACGSPYYLGQAAAAHWQAELRIPARAVLGSEMALYPDAYLPPEGSRPLLVVISRSGATTEVLWALEQFERRFSLERAILVTATPGSPLTQRIPRQILLPESLEDTIAQTRSFSAMYLSVQLVGSVFARNKRLIDILRDAPERVDSVIAAWDARLEQLITAAQFSKVFYLGGGALFGVAQEASLKMTEMSLTEAFAFPFLESRHGPRAIIDAQTLVVGLFGQNTHAHEQKVLAELQHEQQAQTIALLPANLPTVPDAITRITMGVAWPDALQGLVYLPVVQLMAYYRAVAKGENPDESRNLVPFVTLNDEEQQAQSQ
ncbi:MAG: SIS domain-containing protein [Anaerolineae bacterium]